MPKDLESLKKSRQIRKEVLSRYGTVPTSVWDIKYEKNDAIIEYDERKQQAIAKKKHEKMNYDKTSSSLNKAFSMSSQNCRGTSEESGLSTFPPDLVRRSVLFYSKENDTVLDPFAGHNSRMQMTHYLNRNYIGYDVSHKFMEFNRSVAEKILKNNVFSGSNTITLKENSSENIDEPDNSVDFIFTSPPYYKVEYYTDEPEQLYFCKDYDTFLEKMQLIVNQCYRVLKPNCYIAFNVNDFRMNSQFYPYHCDIAKAFTNANFKLWDIVIVKWKSAIGACFASQVEERKITAKSHEYLIIGKKL